MKRPKIDGRVFASEVAAVARTEPDGTVVVLAPAVGLWRDAPAAGTVLGPGALIGGLEVLGVVHRVFAPADAAGLVVDFDGPRVARRAVAFGDVLVRLDPRSAAAAVTKAAGSAAVSSASGSTLAYRSPLSGRYYARPAPDQPGFVSVGDVVTRGQTIALLEVMKTFNRLTYGGDDLPERAEVVAIVPRDEDDLDEGDVILELAPA